MRKMLVHNVAVGVSFLLAALLFLTLPIRPQTWIYPLVRQAAQAKIKFESRDMLVRETPNFIIKYYSQDEDAVDMVALAAEEAYKPVTSMLGYNPPDKTLIVIYRSKAELSKAFGWSGEESAMGVYWGGVIQLLSPTVWLKGDNKEQEFIHSGPMVHEFTHLVFDYATNGNYPRWFTEGLAQYAEYKINGYEWISPANKLTVKIYSMAELDHNFDNLDNQALAYRSSLAAIRYIAEVHGEDKLTAIINLLKKGKSFEQAVNQILGMNYSDYETAWQLWAVENMKNYSDRQ